MQPFNSGHEARPLPDVLVEGARRFPTRTAVSHTDGRTSYTELLERAVDVGRSLAGLGIQPGDHVGILMANCTAYFEVLFGAALAGAVVVPMNTRYRGPELRYVIANADLKAVVTSDIVAEHVDHVQRLRAALPELTDPATPLSEAAPQLQHLVALGDSTHDGFMSEATFRAAAARVPAEEINRRRLRLGIRDSAMIMYTSGTTARPKGCVMSHEMLVRNCLAAGRERLELQEGDVYWNPLPMFHMSTILPLIGILDAGATFAGMTHFQPEPALRMIEAEGATHIMPVFPTITQALINHPDFSSTDLSSVRWMWNVGPPETLVRLQEALPHVTQVTAYGCTEVGGVVCINEVTDTLEQRTQSSGRPYSGVELRIVDPQSNDEVAAGERGEICVRGFSLFDGYHRDPKTTSRAMDDDGWFHTGDVGSRRPDGRVSYHGRYKDMLKVGGENVAAAEIEAVLQDHPSVLIGQVVGVPDEHLVEVAAAFVQLRDGATTSADELIDHCRQRLASFKVPRHVRMVDEWPTSATKIQKFRLREQLREELGMSG